MIKKFLLIYWDLLEILRRPFKHYSKPIKDINSIKILYMVDKQWINKIYKIKVKKKEMENIWKMCQKEFIFHDWFFLLIKVNLFYVESKEGLYYIRLMLMISFLRCNPNAHFCKYLQTYLCLSSLKGSLKMTTEESGFNLYEELKIQIFMLIHFQNI
jgi:hypothetical protein